VSGRINFGRNDRGVGLGASGVGIVFGDSLTVPIRLLLPPLKAWLPKSGICILGDGRSRLGWLDVVVMRGGSGRPLRGGAMLFADAMLLAVKTLAVALRAGGGSGGVDGQVVKPGDVFSASTPLWTSFAKGGLLVSATRNSFVPRPARA
jgi:hypothetical protein